MLKELVDRVLDRKQRPEEETPVAVDWATVSYLKTEIPPQALNAAVLFDENQVERLRDQLSEVRFKRAWRWVCDWLRRRAPALAFKSTRRAIGGLWKRSTSRRSVSASSGSRKHEPLLMLSGSRTNTATSSRSQGRQPATSGRSRTMTGSTSVFPRSIR